MIEFNFTRRQSETSLCVNKEGGTPPNTGLAPKHLFGLRKPVQRSVTYTPRDLGRINKPKEQVALPDRFRWKVRRKSSPHTMASIGMLEHINEEGDLEFSDLWIDRKKDMEQAIKWLRQELTTMKRQDKVLKKRLLDLQATIQHLRGIRSCPTLVQSESSLYSGASWLSLDDGSMANRVDPSANPQQNKDTVMAFRERMLAEFQKSRPNLYLQSRTLSMINVKGSNSEDYVHIPQGPGSYSSSGSAFLTSCSSISEDDEHKSDISGLKQQESLDSLAYSLFSESLDDIPDESVEDVDLVDEKLMQKDYNSNLSTVMSSSSDDDGNQSDCASYEDSTLTRDNTTDKNVTDSLEDILTAVSTAEEREGLTDSEQIVFAV